MGRFLVPGERMVLVHRPHPACLAGTYIALIVGALLTLYIGFRAPTSMGAASNLTWWVLLAMIVYTALRTWLWRRDWFMATDQRLVWRRGIIHQKTAMMPLTKVTDMSFNKSIMGRLLDYGEFVMESAGQDQALRDMTFIPRPDAAYRAICAELFADEDERQMPPMRPVTDDDIAGGHDHGHDDSDDDTATDLPAWREHDPFDDGDVASRLGSYVDRYRRTARTPLRRRLLRGPQPMEDFDHEDSVELEEPGNDDAAWQVSTEHSAGVQRVERRDDV